MKQTTAKTALNSLFLSTALLLSLPAAATDLMSVYLNGLRGDAAANEQAIEQLSAAYAAKPDSPQLQAMLGAVETAAANHAWMPWNKMELAERGLARLDKSLRQLTPLNAQAITPQQAALTLQVQTIAGCTLVNMPEMFNRFTQGYQLLKANIQSPAFSYAPQGAKKAMYGCAIQAANKAGDGELVSQWQANLSAN